MRKIVVKLILIAITTSFSTKSHAQRRKFRSYSRPTQAIQFHIGPSFFLSDLGGADGMGKDGLGDLDPEATRFGMGTGIILRQNAIVGARFDLNYILLHGSDEYSDDYFRNRRNLSVSSHLFEITSMANFRLPLKKTLNGKDEFNLSFGPGLVYFSPTAEFEGSTYNLRRLGTEGQRIDNSIPEYGPISFIIPIVMGYHHTFYNTYSLGIELQARKTFSDYFDDVSTRYYDNDILRTQAGDASANLADRNLGGKTIQGGTKRGNSNLFDNYFFVGFTYRLILSNKYRLF